MTTTPTNTPKDKSPLPAPGNGAATDTEPPAAPPVDRAALSDEQLATRVAQDQAELAARKAKREADFFALVREQARILNIPPARLTAVLRAEVAASATPNPEDRRHFVKPLLWSPKDHSQRWSKRGAAPKWYVDHIAAGGTEEECVIPEGAL